MLCDFQRARSCRRLPFSERIIFGDLPYGCGPIVSGQVVGNPLIRNLWRHNLACAAIAEQLATAGFMDKDTAYTAGVLHDIGRLALAVIRPAEYAALLRRHKGSGASILKEEAELFGTDHCQAGRHWLVSAQVAGRVRSNRLRTSLRSPRGESVEHGRADQDHLPHGKTRWGSRRFPAAKRRSSPICRTNFPIGSAVRFIGKRKRWLHT